jgi:phytol kinase
MEILTLLLISGACIALAEYAKRRYNVNTALTRRVAHIGTSLVAVIAPLYVPQLLLAYLCTFVALILFVSKKYNILRSLHTVERHTYGEVYLPLGVALSAFVVLPHSLLAFQAGVLIMGIADALAGIVGEYFGKHPVRMWSRTKSIEGSLAFFVSTLLITFCFLPIFGFHLLLIPCILTVLELSLDKGLDNLVLPLFAGVLFLTQFALL